MLVVRLLRSLFGYVDFMVEGRFPERFLNLAARKGLNLWRLNGKSGEITGSARKRDIPELEITAKKTMNRLHTIREHGLPCLIAKYRQRSGLLVGAVLFALFCGYMSGFVWSISFELPDMINEYELRSLLREQGFCEGVRKKELDIDGIINRSAILDNRISWMTINITGTAAEIKVSPNLAKNIQKQDTARSSNMRSKADGTVTRVKVKNGTAMVKAGDGISKGQLLVSGVMEYNNGMTLIVDSDAEIYAKTARSVDLSIPKSTDVFVPAGNEVVKSDMTLFGAVVPLSAEDTPEGLYTKRSDRKQINLIGTVIPVYVNTEKWKEYKKTPAAIDRQQAESLLKNRLAFYEVFMLSETSDSRIIRKHTALSESSECFILHADYEIEENVCERVGLEVVDGA